jgi:hypothetical protein
MVIPSIDCLSPSAACGALLYRNLMYLKCSSQTVTDRSESHLVMSLKLALASSHLLTLESE